MSQLPILYSFRRCPYAMRARLAIVAAGRACYVREVVLRDKPAAMLETSPKGTVPVLIDTDGTVLEESLEIMLWALRASDSHHWLVPERGELADALALVAACDGPFKQHLDRYKYPPRYPQSDPIACRDRAAEWLLGLNAQLLSHRYLFGNRPCLADIAIFPFVRQFAHTNTEWFNAQPWPALAAWLQAWLNDPLFEAVMPKFSPWHDGQPPVSFPR